MAKEKTDLKKLEEKVVRIVEKWMERGYTLTDGRYEAARKTGFGYRKVCELTMHLSPRVKNNL